MKEVYIELPLTFTDGTSGTAYVKVLTNDNIDGKKVTSIDIPKVVNKREQNHNAACLGCIYSDHKNPAMFALKCTGCIRLNGDSILPDFYEGEF